MLDDFTGTDKAWFTVTNGGHTDSLDPGHPRSVDRVPPDLRRAGGAEAAAACAIVIAQVIGEEDLGDRRSRCRPIASPTRRRSRQRARRFEADPRLRVLFENGAGGEPGVAVRAVREPASTRWPVPGTERTRVVLRHGRRARRPALPATDGADSLHLRPVARRSRRRCPGTDTDSTWLPLPPWHWRRRPRHSAVAYETAPLDVATP